MYEESGSDNDHIEDSFKGGGGGGNKKNSKEEDYTNMDEKREGKRADLLNKKKPQYHHDIPKTGENEKALATKEMALSNLRENFL